MTIFVLLETMLCTLDTILDFPSNLSMLQRSKGEIVRLAMHQREKRPSI
ncbi:MAG: hypothetical protein ABJO88_05435 [Parasphingorhabdus sp.]